MGDFGALVAVLAVEIGAAAAVLEDGFVTLGLLGLVVVEGVPFRASPIPSLRMVPPNRAADASVGSPVSILVRGSSLSVTLSGLAFGSKGEGLSSSSGESLTGVSCLGDSGIAS